jgi:hypothetical protein
MKIEVSILENQTKVKIKQPGPGERGIWIITGLVPNSGLDNPAYDVQNEKSGRRRIFRRDRLTVMRGT